MTHCCCHDLMLTLVMLWFGERLSSKENNNYEVSWSAALQEHLKNYRLEYALLHVQCTCGNSFLHQIVHQVTMHYDEHHALKLHVTDLQETLNIMKKETDTQLV